MTRLFRKKMDADGKHADSAEKSLVLQDAFPSRRIG
jgi:hypothetical protein